MLFSLIKERNGLIKEISRLLGKGMSNIYLELKKSDIVKTSVC